MLLRHPDGGFRPHAVIRELAKLGAAVLNTRSRKFVVKALRGALGFDLSGMDEPQEILDDADVEAVARVAVCNKVGGLIRVGARSVGLVIPARLDEILKVDQSRAVAKNLVNLVETERVLGILGNRLEVLVIKGPARSSEVFGQLDCRASNDIDILVRREDYDHAGHILCESGYRRGVSRDDRWWHQHLGESPFLPEKGHCTVDLHNKVQQPGGPSPRDLSMFFRNARIVSVANRQFAVPGPNEALLLAYVSASKAMRSGEFWLGYAAEIAVTRAQMSEAERIGFCDMSARQGLARLVGYVDRVVDSIMACPRGEGIPPRSHDAIADLASLPFGDGLTPARRFHRSRLIWQWVDGAGFKRMSAFVRHSAELIVSDMRRAPDQAA